MPKFNLYNLPECTGDDPPNSSRVEVGWSGGTVQIATCTDLRERLEDLGRRAALGQTEWQGLHINMNRDGINELIRNLRRARDAAFGADA